MKITHDQLVMRQAMPLALKEHYSTMRIKQFYNELNGKVYVSFSGGKDSTVLLHLVRRVYPDAVAVFADTGLEFPEIREFVKSIDNVVWVKPKMPFNQVIEKYGFPVISKETAQKISDIRTTKSDKLRNKRLYGDEKGNGKISEKWKYLIKAPFKISSKCCDVMKKRPMKAYENKTGNSPIVGTMASESSLRLTAYLEHGCNSFESKRAISQPLSFWKEQDIWDYIKKYNLTYSTIYDMGYERTGCMFCMFGMQHEHSDLFSENRFQKMKRTHPKQYDYCVNKLGCGKVLDYINVNY